MFLVFVLQHPKATITHVSIVGSQVISLGNVHILGRLIKIIKRPLPINNKVRHQTRTTIRMLRRAKMRGRQDGCSIFKLEKFWKGSQ